MSTAELIRACAETSDVGAWEEFVARFWRPISLSVLRVACQRRKNPEQVADDLVQETYLKLCADRCHRLLEFAGRHPESVQGYISTIAVNVARDHFKALHSQKRGEGETSQLLEDFEPPAHRGSLGGQGATERKILLDEINRCLEICAVGPDQERDRLIFQLYYQQGFSAKAIAALPTIALTAKGVETVILRLTRMLRERLVGPRSQTAAAHPTDEKGFPAAESY
jgi:RNA polymerase sigma factor (sigma-70 family)